MSSTLERASNKATRARHSTLDTYCKYVLYCVKCVALRIRILRKESWLIMRRLENRTTTDTNKGY